MATPMTKLLIDQATTPELEAYYADTKLMWRNVTLIGICNLGWGVTDMIVMPLVAMRLLELGVRENVQGSISAINGWLLMVMVMYFSWKSDHTISRIGRRKPYLFLTAPFIILSLGLFPIFDEARFVWLLVGLQVTKMFFMDIKASTFPLLNIDCVPRPMLARANSVLTIAGGIVGFVAMQKVGDLIAIASWLPYALGAGIMTLTTLVAWFIKEPPIFHPTTERFKLWSTFKVAGQDKRVFWLMAGVAMIHGYLIMNNQWLWFWSKETLGLERKDIFQALSWANLANIVLAFPVGWIIDRWGGFRVVILLWVGQLLCFLWGMGVHDQSGLIILALGTTIVAPLYGSADIMVYKEADPRDVGSITSTNSCIRNGFRALVGLCSGWMIFWMGHNYHVGFTLGMIVSTIGLLMFVIHRWNMQPPIPVDESTAEQTPQLEAVG